MTAAAAVVAAVLLVAIAGFQAALAGGARWGAAAYGGRVAAPDGSLPLTFRVMSGVAVVVLLTAAWIVLAQGGVVDSAPIPDGTVRTATWVIAGYMALNTAGNLASTNRVERVVMGSATTLLLVLTIFVAWSGDGPA